MWWQKMYHKYLWFNSCSIVVSNYSMIILAYITTMKLHKLDICFILLQVRWNLDNVNRFVSTHSFINDAHFEYWQNVGRQNTSLAYLVSVRNRSLLQYLIRHYIKHIILLAPLQAPMPEAFLLELRFFPFLKNNNNNISNFHFDLKRTITFKQFRD